MKKVVHFEVHFVILYSKTELLTLMCLTLFVQNSLLTIRWVYNFRMTSPIYCHDCICTRL
ncbi:hypothetical protein EFT09_02410 [Staphylococcus pseudintermedius]|nr:hypothetical protein [Staphylococcus pseudintermedius]